MGLVMVLGGIRSGKSRYAEQLAAQPGQPVIYLATGAGSDEEMAERIAAHRMRRPGHWRTIESDDPCTALGPHLARAGGDTVLIDGLGGWLGRLMQDNGLFTDQPVAAWGEDGQAGRDRVLAALGGFGQAAAARPGLTIVVADEAGLGGVPAGGAGSRRFFDLSGEAAQRLAGAAQAVWLVVAGQPVALKGGPGPAPPADPGLRLHGDSQVPPGALDFAVNVVPGGPPPAVWERVTAAFAPGAYPHEAEATAALAERHGRDPEEVLVLNGAAEAFWLLAGVLRPARAVCVHPSFTEPEVALRASGVVPERAFREPVGFALDPAQIDPDADLVATGNPNNPTGTLDRAEELAALARPGRALVVDEAFMDFVPGQAESLAGRSDLPGLVVVRSLTKVWSLPGLRAGYLLGPAKLVARLRTARQPWSVNSGALAALEAYATAGRPGGVPGTESIAREVALARDELAAGLGRLPGVTVWPSVANFLLIRIGDGPADADGPAVRAGLLARGMAVRRADTFPGLSEAYLRVAVRRPDDNHQLLAALGAVLEELG